MTRALGIPASLAVLVVVPLLVAPAPTPTSEAPKPVESKLTVQADDTHSRTYVHIEAAGAPPTQEATLASDDGLESGRAAPAPAKKCADVPLRQLAGDAGNMQPWCLELAGLPGHGQVVGTIAGEEGKPSTELELTVKRRADFATEGPLLLLVLGLLTGIVVAVAVPWLSARVGGGRLGFVLATNALAPLARRIGGLADWVTARRAAGDTSEALREKIQPVVDHGPAEAAKARAALDASLQGDPLGPAHPLALAARREARRTDHVIGDFLDAKGDQATHPAATLQAAVTTMKTRKSELDAMQTEMERALKPDCHPPEVPAARIAWARAGHAEDIAGVDEAVTAARKALYLKLATDDCLVAGAEKSAASWDRERSFGGLGVPELLSLPGTRLLSVLVLPWMVATLLCIVVALAFAGVTVALAAYDAKPEYGTWQDDFSLFSAALASGAAGTVVGLLAPWGASAKAAEDA